MILGLGVAVAFWPGFADAAMAPRWAILALGLSFSLTLPRFSLNTIWALAWLLLSLITLLLAPSQLDWANSIIHLVLLIGAFLLGAQVSSLRYLSMGILLGLAPSAVLVMLEVFGIKLVPAMYPPAGLFINKNIMAEGAALAMILALGLRQLYGIALLPAIILTECRAAILGLVLAAATWLYSKSKPVALLLGVAAAFPLLAIVFMGKGLGHWASNADLISRWDMWVPLISNLKPFGWGLGAFHTSFPSINTAYDLFRDRPEFPHNEILDLAFCLGIGAIFPLGLLWSTWRLGSPWERSFLICTVCIAFAGFPLHSPLTVLLIGIVAGHISRRSPNFCVDVPAWPSLLQHDSVYR